MVTYQHWMVATSFWAAMAVLVAAFILLYFLIRVLNNIFGLRKRYLRWRRLRAALLALSQATAIHELNSFLENKSFESFEKYWNQLSRAMRCTPNVATCYLRYCDEKSLFGLSKQWIEICLKKTWFSALLLYYSKCSASEASDIAARIKTAEHWLKKHDQDAILLLTLSKLYSYANVPGKAKSLAEKSIQLRPSSEAYGALAEALERLGQHEAALVYYRKAIQ